jgi:hypothetical protein
LSAQYPITDPWKKCGGLALGLVFFVSWSLRAAQVSPASTNAPSSPNTNNAAIAPADIASQAEATMATLENLKVGLEIDQTSRSIGGELPGLISIIPPTNPAKAAPARKRMERSRQRLEPMET